MLDEIGNVTRASRRSRSARPDALNEAYHYERPSSFSRGLAARFGRRRDPADFRHRQHRRERRDASRRRFPRADAAHVPEHHGAAGGRGRHLEGHRAHHLLPARHRAGLRRVQRRAHRFLSRSRVSIRCRPPPASRPSCAGRSCWWRSKPSPCSATGAKE